jgi:two-component system chemotaxis sensor kinase CheA
VLPCAVTLEQLPKSMTDGRRHFALHYTPIYEHDVVASILVVASDVTSSVDQQRIDGSHRDVIAALRHIVDDRFGFEELALETRGLFGEIATSSNAIEVKRALHTLKGGFATFELGSLASQAHELETLIIDRERVPSEDDIAPLRDSWLIVDHATRFVLDPLRGHVAVPDGVVVDLAHDAEKIGASSLASRIRALRTQTIHARLARLAEHARTLAERLGKAGLQVECKCDETRLPPGRWLPFWAALVHAIRNAVDHGVESPEERVAAGKSSAGKLVLRAQSDRRGFVVEITDDGRGIDWAKVRLAARKVGIDATTRETLVEMLFVEGLSTTPSATETSGRGLGMSAVRAACEKLGGRVVVTSDEGKGTSIRFEFPPASFVLQTLAA